MNGERTTASQKDYKDSVSSNKVFKLIIYEKKQRETDSEDGLESSLFVIERNQLLSRIIWQTLPRIVHIVVYLAHETLGWIIGIAGVTPTGDGELSAH